MNQPAFFLQSLEGGIQFEWRALRLNKPFQEPCARRFRLEIWLLSAVGLCEEFTVGQIEHGALGGCNGIVVHQPRLSQQLKLGLKLGSTELSLRLLRSTKFRQPLKIDIEFIEIQSAVGRIGADVIWRGVLQCVQRIEPDNSSAETLSGPFNNPAEIGEVTAPPVIIGGQRIELQGQSPQQLVRFEQRRDIALLWRNDDTHRPHHLPNQALSPYRQTVVPERETTWGRYLDTHVPSTIEKTDLHNGKPRPYLPFLHHGICFVADLPLQRDGPFFPVFKRQITGQRRSRLTVTQYLHGIAGASPRRLIPFSQRLCQRCSRIDRKAHGSQNGAPSVIRGEVKITCDIVIVRNDAGTFSKSGKKALLRLVLHERSLREDCAHVKLSHCSY